MICFVRHFGSYSLGMIDRCKFVVSVLVVIVVTMVAGGYKIVDNLVGIHRLKTSCLLVVSSLVHRCCIFAMFVYILGDDVGTGHTGHRVSSPRRTVTMRRR